MVYTQVRFIEIAVGRDVMHNNSTLIDPRTLVEILQNDSESDGRMLRIVSEFVSGLSLLKKFPKIATVFGSAQLKSEAPAYQEAYQTGYELAKMGFTVVNGGGPGIMEAVSKGAVDAGGKAVGILIDLPKLHDGEVRNPYVQEWITCKYFFVRKFIMMFYAKLFFVFAGGYGTLDEFYEAATLVQTRKIDPVPLILVDDDHKFWKSNCELIDKVLYQRYHAIGREDKKIYHRVDGAIGAISLVNTLLSCN